MKVVLTRAGGPIADRLVPRLLAAGHDVRVPPPPDGALERRHLPVGVRPADDEPADIVVALAPDPAWLAIQAAASTRLLVATDRDVDATEDVLAAGAAPWTLQVTCVVHDELAAARADGVIPAGSTVQSVDADEVAARLVRLLRAAPAGRVPDFGGPLVDADVDPACCPADWRIPRRAAGTVDFDTWSHRSGPADAIEGGDQTGGPDRLGRPAGVVEQR
jgi:hypothetical protein